MAIAVASSSSTALTASTSVVITKPSGLAVGDLMVASIAAFAGANITIDTASGWTLVQTRSLTNGSISIQSKIATSGDVAAADFTFTCPSASRTGGAILRVTGNSNSATPDESEMDVNNVANSATISFASALTPNNADNLVVVFFGAGDGNSGVTSLGSYTTTPSITLTEFYDSSYDAGTQDPVAGGAYGVYSGTSEITAYGATIANSKDDHAGILAIFQAQVDGSGTTSLHSADADFFAPTASAGVTGTHTLLSADADLFSTTGAIVNPIWTNINKT